MKLLILLLLLQLPQRPDGFVVVMCDGRYDSTKSLGNSIHYFYKKKEVGVSYPLYGVTFWHREYVKKCK